MSLAFGLIFFIARSGLLVFWFKIQLHTAVVFFQVVVALFKLPNKYLHFWCLADPLFGRKQSQKRST